MGTGQEGSSVTNFAINNRRCPLSRVDRQFLGVSCQNLYASIFVFRRIHKHSAAVVVRPENIGQDSDAQRSLVHRQLSCASTVLAVVDET